MSEREEPPTEFEFRPEILGASPEDSGRSDEGVAKLLGLGLSSSDQPFDLLIERLCAPGGPAWLDGRLDAAFGESSGWFAGRVAAGGASLSELESLKQSAKSLYHRATRKGTSLLALAGYFLAVAAALVHHGESISGRDRGELCTAFLDLTDVLPEPWRSVLSAAAQRSEG